MYPSETEAIHNSNGLRRMMPRIPTMPVKKEKIKKIVASLVTRRFKWPPAKKS